MSDVSYLEFFAQIFVTALSIIGLVRALRDPKRLENINLDDLNIFKALSVFLLAIGGLIAPFVWITPYAWELMGLMVNNSMPFPGGILIAAGYTIFILAFAFPLYGLYALVRFVYSRVFGNKAFRLLTPNHM